MKTKKIDTLSFESLEEKGMQLAKEFYNSIFEPTAWGKIRMLRKEYEARRENMKTKPKDGEIEFKNKPYHYVDGLSRIIRELENATKRIYKSGDEVLFLEEGKWERGTVLNYTIFNMRIQKENAEEVELHTLKVIPFSRNLEEQDSLLQKMVKLGCIAKEEFETIVESLKKSGMFSEDQKVTEEKTEESSEKNEDKESTVKEHEEELVSNSLEEPMQETDSEEGKDSEQGNNSSTELEEQIKEVEQPPVKRKRGRPKKSEQQQQQQTEKSKDKEKSPNEETEFEAKQTAATGRVGRGRPKKNQDTNGQLTLAI